MTPLSMSIELLRELIALDAQTGTLTWKPREARHFPPTAKQTGQHKANNWNSHLAGKPALTDIAANRSGSVIRSRVR